MEAISRAAAGKLPPTAPDSTQTLEGCVRRSWFEAGRPAPAFEAAPQPDSGPGPGAASQGEVVDDLQRDSAAGPAGWLAMPAIMPPPVAPKRPVPDAAALAPERTSPAEAPAARASALMPAFPPQRPGPDTVAPDAAAIGADRKPPAGMRLRGVNDRSSRPDLSAGASAVSPIAHPMTLPASAALRDAVRPLAPTLSPDAQLPDDAQPPSAAETAFAPTPVVLMPQPMQPTPTSPAERPAPQPGPSDRTPPNPAFAAARAAAGTAAGQAPQGGTRLVYRFEKWGGNHAVTVQPAVGGDARDFLLQPSDRAVARILGEHLAQVPERAGLPVMHLRDSDERDRRRPPPQEEEEEA